MHTTAHQLGLSGPISTRVYCSLCSALRIISFGISRTGTRSSTMSGWVRIQPFQVEHRSATFDELDEFDLFGRVMRKSRKGLRLVGSRTATSDKFNPTESGDGGGLGPCGSRNQLRCRHWPVCRRYTKRK